MDLFVSRNTQARSSRAPRLVVQSLPTLTANPRPTKRLKVETTENDDNESQSHGKSGDEDADADTSGLGLDDSRDLDPDDLSYKSETAVETAMPSLDTSKDAIEEYETLKASQGSNTDDKVAETSRSRWVKGKSSIYLDAFNLALETVLEDESHLFDEKEMALFDQWKQLNYEAQYL